MASFRLLLFLSVILFINPFSVTVDRHRSSRVLTSTDSPAVILDEFNTKTKAIEYFQVTKPILVPKEKPSCYQRVLRHQFKSTYGKPPVLVNYNPPSHCPFQNFSRIVLEWKATCRGRQFDRIFGVWLNGVELLRSCTAEPVRTGILWRVEKDVTKYHNLLVKNQSQTLAVYMGNIVDKTYTGVYHVDIIFHYYPADEDIRPDYDRHADLVLPISRNLPLNDGLWFQLQKSTAIEGKEFRLPRNVYKASLEVYVSSHEEDEFWYMNFPTDFIVANNLTSPGNGPFREVVIRLDDEIIGAVWPFTVIFTGGFNPVLWRPITGIGSFDLPTYDIEITPFLGKLLDGKTHSLGFSVTNALNVWYVGANMHLWLDRESSEVEAELINHEAKPTILSSESEIRGPRGKFTTKARRLISSSGWVKSSYGKIITHATQDFSFGNSMDVAKSGDFEIVDHLVEINSRVYAKNNSREIYSKKSFRSFPLKLSVDFVDQGNDTEVLLANVTLGFNEKGSTGSGSMFRLRNKQQGHGVTTLRENMLPIGEAYTRQAYEYEDTDLCYTRKIRSSNYKILYDQVHKDCSNRTQSNHEMMT